MNDLGHIAGIPMVELELNPQTVRVLCECFLKFQAEMLFVRRGLSIPTRDEYVGIALLERDDELPAYMTGQGAQFYSN